MAIFAQRAWLELAWLDQQWLSAEIDDATGGQVEMLIEDVETDINAQAEMAIDVETDINGQVELKIETQSDVNGQVELYIDGQDQNNAQVERKIDVQTPVNSQVERNIVVEDNLNAQAELRIETQTEILGQVELFIEDIRNVSNAQAEMAIGVLENVRAQVERKINDALSENNSQVELKIDQFNVKNAQVLFSNLYTSICAGWLETAWLSEAWLAEKTCSAARAQVERKINVENAVNSQVEMRIETESVQNAQVERRIDVVSNYNAQVELSFTKVLPAQVLITLYNITRPRIMCSFPSRGTSGANWTASSTQPGDFSILNVNNDISEFYWRSADTIKSVVLRCDTEITQGIFMDTFYAEGLNWTSSANVVFEGTNDPTYTTIQKSINLQVTDDKIFYVEPTLPLESYRYWQLTVSDPTNTENFLKAGVIIFGASNILYSECTTQDITIIPREFKNAVRTEGFTSVGNSRSLKRSVVLEFRNLSYDSGDYNTLNDVINHSRTTLKCLWLPDPRSFSLMKRFGVFGKIKEIPSQRHNVKGIGENLDFIDLTIEIDEAE